MNILLDTNTYKNFLRRDKEILKESNQAEIIYISVIVIGELMAGFQGGNKMKQNMEILEEFSAEPFVKILNCTRDTALIYAELKYSLSKKGAPIPTNDVWIAAHAIETGSRLITYDKHFSQIPGLRIWDELKSLM